MIKRRLIGLTLVFVMMLGVSAVTLPHGADPTKPITITPFDAGDHYPAT